MSAVTISTILTNLLATLAAGRKSADRRNALRFASLLSTDCELEAPNATEGPDPAGHGTAELVRATLSITSGLHRGAAIELTNREYLIGSDDDCDIVLRDGVDCGQRMETVEATASVEDLLALLAAGATGFRVAAPDGGTLGSIDPKSVIAILDRDRNRRH